MRSIILIFLINILLVTEGVSQNQDEVVPLQQTDTTYLNDELEDAESTDIPYVNPYQQAQEQYKQEAINRRDFTPNDWQKAKDGLDYTLEPTKKDTTNRNQNASKGMDPAIANFILTLVKWFFIIGAIVILTYLILRFIGEGNVFGRQNRRIFAPSVAIDLAHIEENLELAELDPYIKQAIEQKQFALAVRLYYLAILKELNTNEAILWKKEKTNRAYLNEMRPHVLFPAFRTQTRVFERVWYGDALLDETAFYQIQAGFQTLLASSKLTGRSR